MAGSNHHQSHHPNLMTGIQSVGFFWDIENCPVPKGTAAFGVINRVRRLVLNRRDHREFEFTIACHVTRLSRPIQDDTHRAGGVTLSHVLSSSKNAADEKLREAMKRFVDTHGGSSVLVLISGDIDFVNDLRGYQNRQGVNVILLHGKNASKYFIQGQWNEVHEFGDFCIPDEPSSNTDEKGGASSGSKAEGVKTINEVNSSQSKKRKGGKLQCATSDQVAPVKAGSSGVATSTPDPATETEIILMVSGLPGSLHYSVIRPELQKVAEFARGQVKYVNNGQGWITFKNRNDVAKGTLLFLKKEILGKMLKVVEVKSIPFPINKPDPKNDSVTDKSSDGKESADERDDDAKMDEESINRLQADVNMLTLLPEQRHENTFPQPNLIPVKSPTQMVSNLEDQTVVEHRKAVHTFKKILAEAVGLLRQRYILHGLTEGAWQSVENEAAWAHDGLPVQSISFREMEPEVHYIRKVLHVKIVDIPFQLQYESADLFVTQHDSVVLLVQDDKGDVHRAFVYNYVFPNLIWEYLDGEEEKDARMRDADRKHLEAKLAFGFKLSVMDPVLKMGSDGRLALVINHNSRSNLIVDYGDTPNETCRFCFKNDAKSRCANCHKANYCNRTCQAADWTARRHKLICLSDEQAGAKALAFQAQHGGYTGQRLLRPNWTIYDLETLCWKNVLPSVEQRYGIQLQLRKDFGFKKCPSASAESKLLGLYQGMIKIMRVDMVKFHVAMLENKLGTFIRECFDEYTQGQGRPDAYRGEYFKWFLANYEIVTRD